MAAAQASTRARRRVSVFCRWTPTRRPPKATEGNSPGGLVLLKFPVAFVWSRTLAETSHSRGRGFDSPRLYSCDWIRGTRSAQPPTATVCECSVTTVGAGRRIRCHEPPRRRDPRGAAYERQARGGRAASRRPSGAIASRP